jgi:putative FmdB family regulatory protein
MPIYEYRCESCGHTLDALQKISDDPLKECPDCEAIALKRLISAPAFRLKGGGWYETDFKSDKDKRRNLADGGESKPKDDGAAASETKSDAKADSKAGDSKAGDAKSADSKKPEAPKSAEQKSSKGKGSTGSTGKGSKGTGSEAA